VPRFTFAMNTAPTSPSRGRCTTLWLALAIAAVALAVYAPVRHHGFVSIDDPIYVGENPVVARGLSWDGARWAFTTGHAANWHPVTWLSHMADVRLFGLNAGGHHAVSVLLHAANAILLFLLLKRLTGRAGSSACVAVLFAAHPLHVESVAWVAERKDVLSTLFWLLTAHAYVSYVSCPRSAPRRRGAAYALMLALYALGLMAKPMLVTLPLVLLVLDWWPLGRLRRAGTGEAPVLDETGRARRARAEAWLLAAEKLPLFALAAASSAITIVVQHRGGAVSGLAAVPFASRAGNAVVSAGRYLWKAAWPADLSVFYPYPAALPAVPLVLSALFLAAVTGLAIGAARRRPYLLAGWLWYLVTLAPVSGLVQIGRQAMADRYTYVPLVGIFVMLAWGARDLACSGLLARQAWLRSATRIGVPVVAVALVAALAAAARVQTGYWASSAALWQHALDVDPQNYFAHNSLGALASDAGRTGEALEHFSRAVRSGPDYPEAFNNLGLMYARLGRTAEAVEQYRKAIALNPRLAAAHGNLGVALVTLGRPDEAIAAYHAAIAIDPAAARYRSNLGAALYGQGRPADAIAHFSAALERDPALAQAHTGLALSLAATDRLEEAARHFTEAARLQPGSDSAQQYLGTALAALGRFDEATAHLQEALRINPGNDAARHALDMVAARTPPPKAAR